MSIIILGIQMFLSSFPNLANAWTLHRQSSGVHSGIIADSWFLSSIHMMFY